jgi:peptide deformylase
LRRNIVRLGHPILRFPAATVEVDQLKAGELNEMFDDLRAALAASPARTLTAPQLGVELQILAFRTELIGAPDPSPGIQIVVNPMLEPEHGELVYDWEGCLSIPDLRGLVPRYPTVRLRGVDDVGEAFDLEASDEASRILQHAHDHLNGVVFLDRMRDLRSLAFGSEWREFLKGEPTH